jgi:tyrosine-specific transport protein
MKQGSLFGGIMLVAGCCIGAGMLGLPVLSAMAGFIPSVVIFIICWLYMLSTGLLLLEANLWYGTEVSLITLAERTLGIAGKAVTWMVFLFLFYSLMVAYVAASGSLVSDFMDQFTGYHLHPGIGGVLFTLLFGVLLYLGVGAVDWFNRILMFGLIISYALLVTMGASHVETSLLAHQDWTYATMVIPAVIVSFGFHNMIPSLTTYFKGRAKTLVSVIVIGSSIPLFIYLVWEWLILGIVPLNDFRFSLDHGEIATEALRNAVGYSWILDIAQSFAFFAVVTSFLAVALSFVDFLADGLDIKKDAKGKIILILMALLPPLLCALFYPHIFLSALQYAGGYGAVILFGILPALMVWKGRYELKMVGPRFLPGGKPALVVIMLFALGVIALQII